MANQIIYTMTSNCERDDGWTRHPSPSRASWSDWHFRRGTIKTGYAHNSKITSSWNSGIGLYQAFSDVGLASSERTTHFTGEASYIQKIWNHPHGIYSFHYASRDSGQGCISVNDVLVTGTETTNGVKAFHIPLKPGDIIRIGERQHNIFALEGYYSVVYAPSKPTVLRGAVHLDKESFNTEYLSDTIVLKAKVVSTGETLTLTSVSANTNLNYNLHSNLKISGEVELWVENTSHSDISILKSDVVKVLVDRTPPTITFPQETYSKPWGYGDTIQNAYEGTDVSDNSLDYEVEHYVEDVKIGNTLKTKDTTFNTGNFIPYNTETHTFLKVRALQSADTEGGTGTDIWSEWYTSPTTTYTNIPEIITFKPDFLDKIFLQGETKACGELFSCVDPNVQSLEVTHIINEVEDSTSIIEVSQGVEGATITPPLKYHIYNPKDWQYTYQLKIRAKNSIGQYSKYYLSPKTKAEYNIAPKDPTFTSKAFKDIYVVNEKFRVEWSKVTDPNGTDVTYDLALLDSEGTSLATWTKITDNFKEVVIPNVSPQTGCYFTLIAFSDRLYSSKVSSKPFAITDVNITDCNLTFPNLTTNLVIEKVNEIAIVINGDTRLIKTTNLSNYVLPLHYFRSGKNTLTLKVKDKINTVIERTWNIDLTLDKSKLVSSEQPTVTGYFAFNYDNAEHFNKAVELQKSNIDLGVVEHTFLGSTPFEGSNTVTQKLEITRKANDDTTQLRTIKITGAIE